MSPHPLASEGFNASEIFVLMDSALKTVDKGELDEVVKKVKGVFQFDVKNKAGKTESWILDVNSAPGVYKPDGKRKPDLIISVSDEDFIALAEEKLNPQKAFIQGKIKVKGKMLLAAKLDRVMKQAKAKASL
ncbi:sterol-binding-like protein [Conidiobolus coronatus NRRL 28638]|uniref:Sterol-binding-like protein n=1 Tax=Conidiobolus coronatus (strain ATCC 28846 / CBS 209.66 / NRRL 28638) TaxID=796925 RepID=A0A137P871_CONC2|nr:sterol-binding-like protein [Conidiobolus coronatus NRRL 28638]|eukprot:KXN71131.1 sterol-binding-like protein [Conidiobolus coronatus NRRL 28638]